MNSTHRSGGRRLSRIGEGARLPPCGATTQALGPGQPQRSQVDNQVWARPKHDHRWARLVLVALLYWDTLRLATVIATGVVLPVRTAARHYGLKYAATDLITALPRGLVYGVLAL